MNHLGANALTYACRVKDGFNYRYFLRQWPTLYEVALRIYARLRKTKVTFPEEKILISKRSVGVLLSYRNVNYAREIIDYFEFYASSVEGSYSQSNRIVDFSRPNTHQVIGFSLMPIIFPTVSEPLKTIEQYLKILNLKSDEVILDLGAYSGFSSIVFNEHVAKGRVVAVEADPNCQNTILKNFELYRSKTSKKITLYPYAIHSADGVLKFISEGTMANAILLDTLDMWARDENIIEVPTRKLSTLVHELNLSRVDVIKADIEGSEYEAFLDEVFFENFHPRILLEPVSKKGPKGSEAIELLLSKYGYQKFDYFPQEGGKSPLMFCF
jgi:FkbM family methyltransferase